MTHGKYNVKNMLTNNRVENKKLHRNTKERRLRAIFIYALLFCALFFTSAALYAAEVQTEPQAKAEADILLIAPGTATMGWSDAIVEDLVNELTGGNQQKVSQIKILHHEPAGNETDARLHKAKLKIEFEIFKFKLIISHADYADTLVDVLRESGIDDAHILFYNAPEDFDPKKYAPFKISSIIRDRDLIRMLALARAIKDANTIFFLVGYDDNRKIENHIKNGLIQDKRFSSCKSIFIRDTEHTIEEAAQLIEKEKNPAYIIKVSPMRNRKTGMMYRGVTITATLSKASGSRNIIIANTSYGLGRGLTGGFFLDSCDYAKLISDTAKQIIASGAEIQTITKSKPLLDIAELERLKIPLEKVPEDVKLTGEASSAKTSPAMTALLIIIPSIIIFGLFLTVYETMRRRRFNANKRNAQKFVLAVPLPFAVFDKTGRILERNRAALEKFVSDNDMTLKDIKCVDQLEKRILEIFNQDTPVEIRLDKLTLKAVKIRRDVFSREMSGMLFFLNEIMSEEDINKLSSSLEKESAENELLKFLIDLAPHGCAVRAPDDNFSTILSNSKYDSLLNGMPKNEYAKLMQNELETLYTGMDRRITVKSDGDEYEIIMRMTLSRTGANVVLESARKCQ